MTWLDFQILKKVSQVQKAKRLAKQARAKAKFDKTQQKGKGKGRGRGKGRGKGKAKTKQTDSEAEEVKAEEAEPEEVKAEDADDSERPRTKRRLTYDGGFDDSDTGDEAEGPAPVTPEIVGQLSTPGTPEVFGNAHIFGEVGDISGDKNDDKLDKDSGYSPSIEDQLVPESLNPCTSESVAEALPESPVAEALPENPGGQSAASSGDPLVPFRGGGAGGPSGPRGPNQHHTPDTLASVSPPGSSILLNCVLAIVLAKFMMTTDDN